MPDTEGGIQPLRYKVLILGGGFAGAYCAKTLGKALGPGAVNEVALVAERNAMVFHPMLAEVAGSALAPQDVVHPLRQFCRNVDVLQAKVQHIDWVGKKIVVDGGRFTRNQTIHFEHLVVTLGSITDLSRVPGMTEHGMPMKSVTDALRIRNAVINRLEEANLTSDEAVRKRLLTFTIVGGGYTGVETAGQILDFVKDAKEYYANLSETPARVILIHSRAHLLEEIGPELGDHAQRVLEKRGMEIILNSRVSEATAGRITYNQSSFIETYTIISSIGNAPNPAVMDLCRQLGIESEKGRIPTLPSMQVSGHPTLWAAGDCAAVPWDDEGETKTSPPTAQFALRQGSQIAKNILRVLKEQPTLPFTYRYLGQLATVGSREAVAEIMGRRFSGFIAWWMWRTIYLAKLPGTARKLRVIIDWTFELLFPRDLALPVAAAPDPMPSAHFEAGETFIEKGDVCRAYILVRSGLISATAPGEEPREYGPGSIIDQSETENGLWKRTLTAVESTDAIVFRGRMLELLKGGVRLVPAAQPSAPR